MTDKEFYKQSTQPGASDFGKTLPISVEIPSTIGPYTIENLFEKGGMSILYLGTHPETHEPTIIKVLSPKFLSNGEMVERFLKEADIIALADHPNIVKLYGHGNWAGGLYIAMEFIEGESLRQYLLKTPISLKRALHLVLDIAYALCHLHMHGVIHRDLKPENIIVTNEGSIKVIDFGIAQLLTEDDHSKNASHPRMIGTPIYMSPEQNAHPESVSYSSDIYSLGIITYELVLGKLSHGQLHLNLMPKGLRKILSKALQPNPVDRYQDVVDFIADISTYLNSETLLEEKNISDQISELSENIERAQSLLLPGKAPQWPGIEIGFASYKRMAVSGVYQDFFEISKETYGVIIAESSTKNAEGFAYTATSRGMIRALCQLTKNPTELVTLLNDMIIHDSMRYALMLSYLIVETEKQIFHFISCGSGHLWHFHDNSPPTKIASQNIALGIEKEVDFTHYSGSYASGDQFFLNNFTAQGELNENEYLKTLSESTSYSPQTQVDFMMRKAKSSLLKISDNHSISLISLKFL